MANDIAVSLNLDNQQYMAAMAASGVALRQYDSRLKQSARSVQNYEAQVRQASGATRINQSVISNAIFMVEDAASVYGTMGLAGSVRAASNNLTMMASAFGPWGMAAAVSLSTATQLYFAFNKNADSAKKAADALDEYKKELDKIMDIEAERVKFQHKLRDANSAASSFRVLQSEKDALETTEAQIRKAKELEVQRQKELEVLERRKQELQKQEQRDIGPMGPGIGQVDDSSRVDRAEQIREIEDQIAENKAEQAGNQQRVNDLVVQQAGQQERIAQASKRAKEVALAENRRLQEQKRAQMSAKKARQDRARAAEQEAKAQADITASVQAQAEFQNAIVKNKQGGERSTPNTASGARMGDRSFAEAMARARQNGFEGPQLSARDSRARDIMKQNEERLKGPFRDTFKSRRDSELASMQKQRAKLEEKAKPQDRKSESQQIVKAVEAGTKATNKLLADIAGEIKQQAQTAQSTTTVQLGGLSL